VTLYHLLKLYHIHESLTKTIIVQVIMSREAEIYFKI
jgi:hypothetical protein